MSASTDLLALADQVKALPPADKLRVASALLDAGDPARERLANRIIHQALNDLDLAYARRELAAHREAERQHALQTGETVR